MGLQERLLQDLKSAMKSGDKVRVETIRLLRAQLKNAQIAKGGELSPEEEIGVLTKAVKKRKEAMELYQKGERMDLFEKEERQLKIISEYLPKPLTREEVEEVVSRIIQRVGATGLKDLGKVMPEAMKELKGRADGKLVQQIAREKLS